MHWKNSLQKAADGCIRNRKGTHYPENPVFPGFCDYEVMKMNILGTDYELIKDCDELTERNVDGECQSYGKVIRIRPLKKMLLPVDSDAIKQQRYNEVVRHEVIHAFFHESGLDGYSADEQLVDWLAMQFPKMYRLFKEHEVLE